MDSYLSSFLHNYKKRQNVLFILFNYNKILKTKILKLNSFIQIPQYRFHHKISYHGLRLHQTQYLLPY